MALTAAKFSEYMGTFVGRAEITAAFAEIEARQVNVLKRDVFPLLAYWVNSAGDDAERSSGGDSGQEVTYLFLVAQRLGENQRQDEELGKLVKVIKDLAGAIEMTDPVDFSLGDWDTDNNADDGDGAVVWASFPVTVQFTRPPGDY